MIPGTPTTNTPPPLRITIGGPGSKPFKSIDALDWPDIPPFAVLTGLNGSGKTQLLELLAYKLTNALHPELGDLGAIQVTVTGAELGPDAVAYLPSGWEFAGVQGLGLAHMKDAKLELYQELQEASIRHDVVRRAKRARLERLLGVSRLEEIGPDAFARRLPDDLAFMLDEADITSGLVKRLFPATDRQSTRDRSFAWALGLPKRRVTLSKRQQTRRSGDRVTRATH